MHLGLLRDTWRRTTDERLPLRTAQPLIGDDVLGRTENCAAHAPSSSRALPDCIIKPARGWLLRQYFTPLLQPGLQITLMLSHEVEALGACVGKGESQAARKFARDQVLSLNHFADCLMQVGFAQAQPGPRSADFRDSDINSNRLAVEDLRKSLFPNIFNCQHGCLHSPVPSWTVK